MRQLQALSVMMSGRSVFLTGSPGAGKTYVLNEFIRRATQAGRRVAVTASTGIAATHIGGATIHSWSGLGIRDSLTTQDKDWLRYNGTLLKRYLNTDVLVIDEVSMLHGKRLDMVNEACKIVRGEPTPFGGLQVVLVGDLFQLPPVSRGSEPADFVHTSNAWAELNPAICYLTEQHRQAGDRLLDVLEAMRRGDVEDWHVAALQERLGKKADSGTPVTRLYAHNIDVDSINDRHLSELEGETKTFTRFASGPAAKVEQLTRSILAPESLVLKKGAEVMFVANNFAQGFVNGSRGRVVSLEDSQPQVQLLSNGRTIRVEPHSWTLQEDGKKRAEVSQLPLRLAWAITIHKSQGMSLDAAEIDLGKSFTFGMGYVALSRVRSLDGVYLTGMNAMAMKLHPAIFELDSSFRSASGDLAAVTEDYQDIVTNSAHMNQQNAVNPIIFGKLKSWRMRRAQVDGVPPYLVAHDSVLESLAMRLPKTYQQLAAIPGIGPRKLDLYGDNILEIIRDKT